MLYCYEKVFYHSNKDYLEIFSIVYFVGCHNFITLSCEAVSKDRGLSSKVHKEFTDWVWANIPPNS